MKVTAKFHDTKHFLFEDTKRIMSPEKFRDFRETGPRKRVVELKLTLVSVISFHLSST